MTPQFRSEPLPDLGPVEGSTIFSTPICSATLPQASRLNEPLTMAIMERAGDEALQSTVCWSSPWNFPSHESGPGRVIALAARRMASKLMETCGQVPIAPDKWRVSCRSEVITGEHGSTPVSEPGAGFTGLYMVAKDKGASSANLGGLLEFQDPRGAAPVMYAPTITFRGPGSESLGVTQTLTMTPGLLIVYPALLMQSFSFYRGTTPHITLRLRIESG